MKDSQKSKVFNAETMVRGPRLSVFELETLGTLIVKSSWFNKQIGTWPDRPYKKMVIIAGRGTQCSVTFQRHLRPASITCRLADPYMAAIDVHHLIAHAVTQDDAQAGKCTWHGAEFCKVMLASVLRWEGRDAKLALQAAFREKRVRSRVYSAEARQGMQDRAKNRYALDGLRKLHAELSGLIEPEDDDTPTI